MALGAYQYKIHLEHLAHGPFDRDYNNFAFHKNRKKDFPWTCSDCALFDSKWYVIPTAAPSTRPRQPGSVADCRILRQAADRGSPVRSWEQCRAPN